MLLSQALLRQAYFQWTVMDTKILRCSGTKRRDSWLLSPRQDTYTIHSKAQGKSQKKGWKECKKWKIGRQLQNVIYWAWYSHCKHVLRAAVLAYTGPVNISISRLLLSIAYSALLLHDGKPSTVYTSIPSSDKAVPQNKGCNITRWPNILTSIGILWDTVIHSPSLTKMLLCAMSPHLFLSCLELGGTLALKRRSPISLFFAWHCEYFVTIPKINTLYPKVTIIL